VQSDCLKGRDVAARIGRTPLITRKLAYGTIMLQAQIRVVTQSTKMSSWAPSRPHHSRCLSALLGACVIDRLLQSSSMFLTQVIDVSFSQREYRERKSRGGVLQQLSSQDSDSAGFGAVV